MTWMPPEDQQRRDQAIDPRLSVHVEAPAGSGKTTVLMKRYLALLAQVREPEEILALTFTRKAAGELRARIQNELNKRQDPSESADLPPHEAELRDLALAAVRRHADKGIALLARLQINTFHSFCAQLLRLVPQRTGLPPDFTLQEEVETARLQKEAVEIVRQRLNQLAVDNPVRQALVRRLVRLNNNWPRLAAELQDLVARRDILSGFITLARTSRDPAAYEGMLRDHMITMIGPRLSQLNSEFRQTEIGRRWPELYRCLADSGSSLSDSLPPIIPGAGLEDLAGWRSIAQGILTTNGKCYKKFTKPKFPRSFKDSSCCQLLQNLPDSLVQRLQFFREMSSVLLPGDEVSAVQDLIIVLHQVLMTFESLCSVQKSLDFIGLEQIALELLATEELPELFQRLDRRLTHLLVDEFQDTSVNQMRLLCRLLAGWQGDRQRTLMVVGDPKQSIYGWRQARLSLFFQSRQVGRLPDCPESPGFTTLDLNTNFRSTGTLIDWANQVFGQTIMIDSGESGVDFKPAAASPGADPGKPPQLTLFTGSQARAGEADWLAEELLQICRRQEQSAPEHKESVGVLLFTRTHLGTYLEAWRRAGLNLRVRDGLPLDDSVAVKHVHNLAKALVRPHDDLAWAALLRGFAGPQPLGRLAEIKRSHGDFWSEKICHVAGSAGCLPEVDILYQTLAAAGRRVGREPLDVIVNGCLRRFEGWKKLAAWEGPQGVANARAYLELLAAAAAPTPEATLLQAEDLLSRAYQPPDPRAQDSPVEVLTVHAAKGLEFDHVFLPFLDWQPERTGKKDAPFLMEEVPATGTAVIALNRSFLQKEQSLLYQTLSQIGRRNALAEARRLFYVAVTRARKRLYMSGIIRQNAAGDWNVTANTPLGWLRRHYQDGELDGGSGTVNLWQEPPLPVRLFGEDAKLSSWPVALQDIREVKGKGAGEEPYDIKPEPRPYELQFPSRLGNDAAATEIPDEALDSPLPMGGEAQGEGGYDGASRLRGEISHRLLETLAGGGALPEPGAVAQILQIVIGSPTEALSLAQDILAEIKVCREDPFLAPLLSLNLPLARSEWLLEAWHDGNTIYRGQIDRLVFDGRQWWLLDYKTSRPGAKENWPEFIAAEVKKYRPQLLAYREMAAGFYHISPPELIQTVLYFTAGQRHVLI